MPDDSNKITITEKDGAPYPDPFNLSIVNAGRRVESEQTKITFVNSTSKTVKATIATTGFFDSNEFNINSNQEHKVINLKRDSPKGAVHYSLCFENGTPPNGEPTIIVDPDTGGH